MAVGISRHDATPGDIRDERLTALADRLNADGRQRTTPHDTGRHSPHRTCRGRALIGIGDIVSLGLPVAQIAARLLAPSLATSAASKSSARRLRRVRIGAMQLTYKMSLIADYVTRIWGAEARS